MRPGSGAGGRLGVVLAALAAWLLAGAAPAAAISERPAATLLLPYFEVDLARADGLTTLFTINNASAAPALARVTLWSDLGVPVLGFTVYLTGYDVQRVDVRDVLAGHLPATSSGNPACDAPPLSPADVAALRSALTGGPSAFHGGQCVGRALGDGRARGYVTVDSMNLCTTRLPDQAGYFVSGGNGDAGDTNVLWGHYEMVDRGRDGPLAVGNPLVHVVADPALNTGGTRTFYGRLLGFSAADNRHALATTFAVPYFQPRPDHQAGRTAGASGIPYTRGTELLVWRDPGDPTPPFACGTSPSWLPLEQTQIVAFDEQERFAEILNTAPFPAATQRVPIAVPALAPASEAGEQVPVVVPGLPVAFEAGWLYLNLNAGSINQAWVEVLHDPGGRLSVLQRPVHLDTAGP